MSQQILFRSILFYISAITLISCGEKPAGGNSVKKEEPILVPQKQTNKGFDKDYRYYDNDQSLRTKLFYFLTTIERNTVVVQKLRQSSVLEQIRVKYNKLFNDFTWNHYSTAPELGKALLLNQEDISAIEREFEGFAQELVFQELIDAHIRPSGKYENYMSLDSKYLMRLIWRESIAKGINTILQQYLIGEKPKYASDGMKHFPSEGQYKQLISNKIDLLNQEERADLFCSKLVSFAINLLELNDRNEAVRFEPLMTGHNAAAIQHLTAIQWDKYSYASILLLGDSPNSPGDDKMLSSSAKQRISSAVSALQAKIAPVVIISGANIYPYQTPYFEAIEMKKWMMEKHGINERQIIVEPVARHTTTNLRNGARTILRYKIPANMKSLIITTKAQNDIISATSFHQRCVNELGYMPVLLGDRLSPEQVEFTPLPVSFHTNTLDPLDP